MRYEAGPGNLALERGVLPKGSAQVLMGRENPLLPCNAEPPLQARGASLPLTKRLGTPKGRLADSSQRVFTAISNATRKA